MIVGLRMAYKSHKCCDLATTKPCNVCLLGSWEESIYAINLKLIEDSLGSVSSRVKVTLYRRLGFGWGHMSYLV